jgi:enterochelin esterase-like enzyme
MMIGSCLTRSAAFACLLALVACGGGGGGSNDGAPPPGSPPATKKLSITSSYTGMTYPVTIYLPAGYSTSTNAKAAIYAMDDELQGSVVASEAQGMGLDAIVVSIGYINADRRFVDFDLPGATAYFNFLTLEAIPRVEAEVRADSKRRTLMGYSLSGLAAMIVLLEDAPAARHFSGYVMTDPSLQFHTQELYDMEQKLWDTTHKLPVAVHHCSTAANSPSAELEAKFLSRGYEGLRYQFRLYPLSHAAVLVPCIDDGLRWVFGPP